MPRPIKNNKPQSLTSWNWAWRNRRVHRGHKGRWRRGKWQLDSKFMRKEWRGEESCWGKPWVLASAYKVFAKGSRRAQANITLAVLAQRRRHRIQNLWATANTKMKYLPWHKLQIISEITGEEQVTWESWGITFIVITFFAHFSELFEILSNITSWLVLVCCLSCIAMLFTNQNGLSGEAGWPKNSC